MRGVEICKPYTMPETATDEALARCYAWDIARDPRMAFGLKLDGNRSGSDIVATHNNLGRREPAPVFNPRVEAA